MSNLEIVKVDEGAVNARILARESKVDFRRIEAASLKIRVRFTSAEGKRLFVRAFNTLQLNTHFISVIARTRLDHDEIARIEGHVRSRIDAATTAFNKAIDGAEALFKVHGITSIASYDTVPLDLDVPVLSSTGRRFLEVLGKLDQLMPLLQTLEIHEVISTQDVDIQRAFLKRQVREIANGARSQAAALRRRMNELDTRQRRQGGDATSSEMAAEQEEPLDPSEGNSTPVGADSIQIVSEDEPLPSALVGSSSE